MWTNLSAFHMGRPELARNVAAALGETKLPSRSLTLEITESAVTGDAEGSAATLCARRELGVRIAVDDFGTGYSSLTYLHRFPVDVLKIDRSFVGGLGRASESAAIFRAVLGLANALHLRVVAEGVETPEQRERLRALGCELGQGYLFSRPLPAEALEALLAELPRAERGGSPPEERGEEALLADGSAPAR